MSLKSPVYFELNQKYEIFLTAICEEDESKNPKVYGRVIRVALDENIMNKIKDFQESQNNLELLKLYLSQGIWQESLMLLINHRDSYPQVWEALLQVNKFDELIDKDPISPTSVLDVP